MTLFIVLICLSMVVGGIGNLCLIRATCLYRDEFRRRLDALEGRE